MTTNLLFAPVKNAEPELSEHFDFDETARAIGELIGPAVARILNDRFSRAHVESMAVPCWFKRRLHRLGEELITKERLGLASEAVRYLRHLQAAVPAAKLAAHAREATRLACYKREVPQGDELVRALQTAICQVFGKPAVRVDQAS